MLSSLKSPGTMADDASTGSRSWSTPDNAKVSDNTYTIATIDDPGCFLAGTEITTPNGIEKIERIIKGDVITSYDKNTKKFVSSKVRTIFSLSREGYFLLKTNSQKIFVTAEHPFLTIKGWKMVKELRVGNKLLTEKGYVKLLQKDFIKKQITVFNLKVEEPHTYIANGFIVHNKPGGHWTTVRLVKGGVISGNNNASGDLSAVENYTSFGSSVDLWGLGLTPGDVNAADFGVVINVTGFGNLNNYITHYLKATNFGFTIPPGAKISGVLVEIENKLVSGGAEYAYVDHVRITIYYKTIKDIISAGSGMIPFPR